METKQAGENFAIPVLGFGTWMMGGDLKRNPDNDDEADVRALRRAIGKGVTHIDTAELYAGGFVEKIVGKAIKNFERSQLFIASKAWSANLKYDDVIKSAINSLKRLDTEYLDLYYIHEFNREIPLRETLEAMDTLVRYGLIRNIGVSNFNVEQLRAAQACTKHRIVANQVHYNLVYRKPEANGMLEYCRQHGVVLVAWRPLQEVLAAAPEIVLLERMSEKYDKTLAQIALNWLVSQAPVAAISTMRTAAHLRDNLEAVDWKMDERDIERLRRELPQALREKENRAFIVSEKLSRLLELPLLR